MSVGVGGAFTRAIDPTGMIMKGPQPPGPTDPGPAPTETNSAVQQARADVNRRRRSFLALNPTGGTGDLSTAPSVRKTLLGQG